MEYNASGKANLETRDSSFVFGCRRYFIVEFLGLELGLELAASLSLSLLFSSI